ncbi:MAG: molybdopterin-binding protein [Gammaproteobacteria bacterium]|jgi:molybdopterin molybdotransferase
MSDNNRIQTSPGCTDDVEPSLLSVEDALGRIMDAVQPVQAVLHKPLRDALGEVLAGDVISPINVPNHTNSAMDGYALRGEELPVGEIRSYRVIGTAYAGVPFEAACKEGECVRIMTGAPMPAGTDTVVMQEQTEACGEDCVRIGTGHRSGQNVRQAGEDIAAGSCVLPAGRRINPADLGVLASLGFGELAVRRPLRVAFFSTGDELRSIGEPLAQGEVYDSNRYALHGMLKQLGAELLDMGVVRDRPELIEAAFRQASGMADVVITSGGVSVGEADYIREVLAKLGEVGFWKIAIKPGRPLAFGRVGEALFFGLPGNPVAVMVTFLQFVKPALLKMAGQTETGSLQIDAICRSRLRKKPGRTEFQRGTFSHTEEGIVVEKSGYQGSGVLTSMTRGNCFILLPAESEGVEPGDRVLIQPFGW